MVVCANHNSLENVVFQSPASGAGAEWGGGVGKKPLIPSITQVAPLWSAMHIRHMVLNQEWFCLPGGHLASFRDSSECYKWASTDI